MDRRPRRVFDAGPALPLQDSGLDEVVERGLEVLNPRAETAGGGPAEAAADAVRLALLPDDGPTGQLFSWDGTVAPW